MQNDFFSIEIVPENGALKSLILNNDPAKMNWIEGLFSWGMPAAARSAVMPTAVWGAAPEFEFTGIKTDGNEIHSFYRQQTLELEVVRTLKPDRLIERYIYRNTGYYDLYFQRGNLGIYTTFNDSYQASSVCIKERCHAHIWCGGEHSYVHAMKMGPFSTELALILTQGSLDSYSVERIDAEWSNDRGDFILHPSPCHLLPGAEMVIEWELVAFPQGDFKKTLLAARGGIWAEFTQETVFTDEKFELTVESCSFDGEILVSCRGESVPYKLSNGKLCIEYQPKETGEHRFDIQIGSKEFWVYGYCSLPFGELLEKRVRFILKHQQMKDPASPLYGAFLIYDNEEHAPYYDYIWRDHNSSGERGSMGLLICRWAQLHPEDAKAQQALELYEEYLLRETFEVDTGIVHGDIGKHSPRTRLYNTAFLTNFWQELYRLRKDIKYLHWIARSIRLFYENGGLNFYPNGTLFADAINMIREGGLIAEADTLTEMLRKHVAQICANRLYYPEHEVRFEQTIVTSAVAIPAAFYDRIKPDPEILRETAAQIDQLRRFSGDQPDYRLNEIPIRHWDEFWFGKRRLYGDTMPHYHSGLSARAYLLYSRITGERGWCDKARKCLRNCLCIFLPDGTASCAYFYPYTVTMRNADRTVHTAAQRGEFFDPFANDQDGVLYVILSLGGAELLKGIP